MRAPEIERGIVKTSDELDKALSRFYTSTMQLTRGELTSPEIAAIYYALAIEFMALRSVCENFRKLATEKAEFHRDPNFPPAPTALPPERETGDL